MRLRNGGYEYWAQRAHSFDSQQVRITGSGTEQEIDRWLERKLKPDDRVLDLGCGTGRYAKVIAEYVEHVTAADRAAEMLDEARAKLRDRSSISIRCDDPQQAAA